MKNRSSNVGSELEDVVFDSDDPDFCQNNSTVLMKNNNSNLTNAGDGLIAMPSGSHVASVKFKIPAATVSLANIHCPLGDIYSPLGRSSVSVSSSLSDLVGSPLEISVDNVVTIEELRQHIGSCFTCGVSWTDDHISLDCSECGGYSLGRPCPLCDGKCGVQWKRDFTMSHTSGKARWVGVCPNYPEALNSTAVVNITTTTTSCVAAAATQVRLARELCTRLEQLTRSASSFSHTHI